MSLNVSLTYQHKILHFSPLYTIQKVFLILILNQNFKINFRMIIYILLCKGWKVNYLLGVLFFRNKDSLITLVFLRIQIEF